MGRCRSCSAPTPHKLKQRYWMKLDQQQNQDPNQIWLIALPKFQAQAADFTEVDVILDRATAIAQYMQVWMPNRSHHMYIFDIRNAAKNNPLASDSGVCSSGRACRSAGSRSSRTCRCSRRPSRSQRRDNCTVAIADRTQARLIRQLAGCGLRTYAFAQALRDTRWPRPRPSSYRKMIRRDEPEPRGLTCRNRRRR